MLEAAVECKIEETHRFVQWWDEKVTPNRGTRTDISSDLNFSCSDAEGLTGISHVQVSRWRKRLQDEDAYRQTLYGAAYRKQFIHSDKLSGWESFCVERLGIAKQTANKLITVSQDGRFGTHVYRIPSSWGTLYELTKLDDETFQAALDEGVIHPEMERKDAPISRYTTHTSRTFQRYTALI